MSDRFDPDPLVSLRERHDLFMAALRELMKLHGVTDIETVEPRHGYAWTIEITYDYQNDLAKKTNWRIKEGGVVEECTAIQITA